MSTREKHICEVCGREFYRSTTELMWLSAHDVMPNKLCRVCQKNKEMSTKPRKYGNMTLGGAF
jgi:hypothetical protein